MGNQCKLQHTPKRRLASIRVWRISRSNRDLKNFKVFYNWFEKFEPFDTNSGMESLANGLAAKDNSKISCDNAESIRQTVQQPIENLPITDAEIAVGKKIKTLVNLTKGLDVNSSLVYIDPTILLEAS